MILKMSERTFSCIISACSAMYYEWITIMEHTVLKPKTSSSLGFPSREREGSELLNITCSGRFFQFPTCPLAPACPVLRERSRSPSSLLPTTTFLTPAAGQSPGGTEPESTVGAHRAWSGWRCRRPGGRARCRE